jgi:hypothetical protein
MAAAGLSAILLVPRGAPLRGAASIPAARSLGEVRPAAGSVPLIKLIPSNLKSEIINLKSVFILITQIINQQSLRLVQYVREEI